MLCALVLLVVVIGTHNSDFVRSRQPVQPGREQLVLRHDRALGRVPARARRDRPLGRLELQPVRRDRRADDDARLEPLDRRVRRHPLRRHARPRQRPAGDRPATAGDHRHARHLLGLSRALARAQPLGGRRAAGRQRQLLPVLAELRRQGADARDHLRRRSRSSSTSCCSAPASASASRRSAATPRPRASQAFRPRARGSSCSCSSGSSAGSRARSRSGQFGAIDTNSGSDFLLTVVAAVIIGGTPLSGGSGTVDRRALRRADHRHDRKRDRLLQHRRHVEHIRHGRGDHPRGRGRPGGQMAARGDGPRGDSKQRLSERRGQEDDGVSRFHIRWGGNSAEVQVEDTAHAGGSSQRSRCP